ncbi:dipeptidylpeptidase, partial [Podila epicladia]
MASWDQIRNEVRSFRASVQPTVTTIRDFVFDSRHDRIYFFANDLSKSSKAPMLFRVDLPKPYSEGRDRDQDLDQDMDDEHDHTLFERDMESSSSYEDLSSDQDMGLVPFHPDTYQFAGPPSLHHTIPALIPRPRGSHPYNQNDPGSSFSFGKASSSSPPSGGISPGTPSLTDQILAAAPVLTWVPVLSEDWLKHAHATLHSPSERLSSFQFEPQVNRLMFPYGAVIYIGNVQEDGKVNPQPARPMDHGRASNLSRPPYAGVSQNTLTASFNFVSVSGPLTSPRAAGTTGTGTQTNGNSNPNSNSNSPNIDKGSPGGRNDPKLGGTNLDLIAFTRDQDIWVMTTSGVETQLTFCSRNSKKSAISCGIAEFVMQEEFHRFTNYYWAPSCPTKKSLVSPTSPTSPVLLSAPQPQVMTPDVQTSGESSPLLSTTGSSSSPILDSTGHTPPSSKFSPRRKEQILYLQVSEAMVDLVTISRQGMQPDHEEYRYPHAGTPNAASDLQIVEFIPKQYDEDHVGEPLHKRLWGRASLYKLFPWLEYIVRFGWLPDGERRQQITAIVTIPLECFMSVAEQAESSEQVEDELASRIRVIFEEQSDCWINVTDIMHFFPTPRIDHPQDPALSADMIQFIISSETTGFRHLYLATHSSQAGLVMTPITSGKYQVVDKQITVDADRQLVYFIAKKDSVLETHLYVASYARGAPPDNVRRLTELGFSHQVTVDVEKSRFLTLYSSIDQSPACAVMHLRWADCKASGLSAMPIEGVQDGPNAPWCSCGCQLPKISSHAFVIREGITNLFAKKIRQFPIVPAQGATNGHARSCSDSSMTRVDSQALSTSSGTIVNGFKSGSMNSISGFLASHLLSTHLLPSSRTVVQESMVVVSHGPNGSSAPTMNNLSSSPTSNSWRGSLRYAPNNHPSGSSTSSASTSNMTAINAVHHPAGEFFTFMSSDNVKLHGCLYRPANYVEGQKYPTLVSIYGGPRSQMVTNEYKLPKFL